MENIKKIFSEGNTLEAINQLEKYLKDKGNQERLDDLLLLKVKFNRWKSQELKGLKPSILQLNEIENALLELINLSNSADPSQEIEDINDSISVIYGHKMSRPGRKKNKWTLVFSLTIIAVVLSGGFYFKQQENGGVSFNRNNINSFRYTDEDEKIGIMVAENIGLSLHPIFEKNYLSGQKENDFDLIGEAELIITDLSNYEDENLNITSQVYKYLGLAMCHKVIALTTSSVNHRIKSADLMIEFSKKGVGVINAFEDGKVKIKEKDIIVQVEQWLLREDLKENLQSLTLIGHCIKKLNEDDTYDENEMAALVASLRHNDFLVKEGYAEYPVIKSTVGPSLIQNK